MWLHQIKRAKDLAKFLYVQRVKGFSPPTPCLDPEGLERFVDELAKATSYLEFGSGGSTLLVDKAGIPGVSVESDRFYAKVVQSCLSGDRMKILTPDIGMTGGWGMPLIRNHAKWRRYIEAPFPITPFPDFVLIDGRFRVACALETARQAYLAGKQATLMFDDYRLRPWYHSVEKLLGVPQLTGRAAFFIVGERPIASLSVDTAATDAR